MSQIGIVLGADKDNVLVEYALGGMSNQLFASKYRLSLPDKKLRQKAVGNCVMRLRSEKRCEGRDAKPMMLYGCQWL